MKSFILLLFLSSFLSACVANEDISSISDKVSNASNKFVSLLKSEETTKPFSKENLTNQKNSKILTQKDSVTIRFIEWRCETFFGSTHVLNVGYFPNFNSNAISIGALTLETNNEMYPTLHSIVALDNKFYWGGEDLSKYMILIKPGNTAYYYDFSDAKKGETRDSKETLQCNRETFHLKENEVRSYTNSFKKIFKKYGFDIDEAFKK